MMINNYKKLQKCLYTTFLISQVAKDCLIWYLHFGLIKEELRIQKSKSYSHATDSIVSRFGSSKFVNVFIFCSYTCVNMSRLMLPKCGNCNGNEHINLDTLIHLEVHKLDKYKLCV